MLQSIFKLIVMFLNEHRSKLRIVFLTQYDSKLYFQPKDTVSKLMNFQLFKPSKRYVSNYLHVSNSNIFQFLPVAFA